MRQICFIALYICASVAHFLATGVVILFVLSTLNILNRNIFHIKKIEYFEIIISFILCILSIRLFFKSRRKISRFIKNNFFPDLLP